MKNLNELRSGNIKFDILLDDPAGNCFVYNPNAPEDDPKIKIEIYERTAEQNDDLGLTGMDTDPESYTKNNK